MATIESRNSLNIEEPPTVDQGDFYIADGKSIQLLRRTDQVVITLKSEATDDEFRALTEPGAPLEGFEVTSRLSGNTTIFTRSSTSQSGDRLSIESLQSLQQKLEERSVIESVGVTFFSPEYHSSLALLNEVIVSLKSDTTPEEFFGGDARFSGYKPLLGTPDQFIATVAAGTPLGTLQLANQLQLDPRLNWSSPNFYRDLQRLATPNDPLFPDQWHLNNTGQFEGLPGADVGATLAWDITTGSSNVVIAAIDDGLQLNHPDLNIFTNPGEIAGNGIDDDGNGWIDDVNGWDFTSNDNDPGPSTVSDAHSTAVSGIAAAAGNNGLGVTGISQQSRILPARIFTGDTATSDANIASAIYYAAGRTANGLGTWNAAHILNNSWGGSSPSTAITNAFTWASNNGILSFIASGNSGSDSISYPASLAGTLDGVAAVGASNNFDERSFYSQYGSELDFLAPSNGGSFGTITTDRTGADGYNPSGDYTNTLASSFGGTSSASPLAAGIASLALAIDPNLTITQVMGLMRNSTDLIGPLDYDNNGFNSQYGFGKVNAGTVVQGVGIAEIQVLEGVSDIPSGTGTSVFQSPIGFPQTKTFRVRNQGTEDLTLGAISGLSGSFTLASGFTDTTLSAGESANFSIQYLSLSETPVDQVISFATNDADENLFQFNLRGMTAPITGTIFNDVNNNSINDPSDPKLPGWTVYLDQNNNSVLDPVITNSIQTSPNIPRPLVDFGAIQNVLPVSGLEGLISDVNITLNLTHTWNSDLTIELISPSGTYVPLVRNRGGNSDNFTNTVFDDEAASSISSATGPFTGSFRPESPLSILDNESPNGDWRLQVTDVFFEDTGNLVDWSLDITTAEPQTVSDVNGFYSFPDIPVGDYTVRRVLQPGWVSTLPTGDSYDVNLTTEADTAIGRDFGQFDAATNIDLSITKTDGVDNILAGAATTYTIVASNAGLSDAAGATITDTFPAELGTPSWTSSTGGATGVEPSGTGNISDTVTLPAGSSITYTVIATVAPNAADGTIITNTAIISPPSGVNDPNLGNNTGPDTTTVNALPDLTITKVDTPDPVLTGGTLNYTLTIKNDGGKAATGIVVKDTLPSGFTFDSTSVTNGFTANESGGIVTFSNGSLTAGQSATLTITGTAPETAGLITNTAVVDPDNTIAESNENNNTASTNTTVTTPTPPGPPGIPGIPGPPGTPPPGGTPTFPIFPPPFVPPALTPTIEPPPGGALPPIYLSTTTSNNFRGTEAPEFIYGGPFDDTIDGAGGNDTILGREGRDLLIGGNGSDKLFGNQGDDRLYGGDGDDTVYGGKDNDFINGERGHDFLRGDLGDDTVRGGDGDDTLYGGKGNDSLLGDRGDDYLSGDLGDDTLDGVGRDRESVGEIDTLVGGEGANLFVLGTTNTVYYNNIGPGAGYGDYALIEDFNASQDRLQLKGGVPYLLNFSPNGLPGGTGIYIDDGSTPGVWDEEDELIAVLKDIAPNDSLFSRMNFV